MDGAAIAAPRGSVPTHEPASRSFLLAGEPVNAGSPAEVVFPFDAQPFAHVVLADADACEAALRLATEAAPTVAAVPPFERAEILLRAAALVGERTEELARQMTLETGNAIWETRIEVRRTTEILRAAAEETRRIVGEVIPIDAWPNGRGRRAHTQRFPAGVVLAITPYNAPLLLVAHKLASAFAAGNPCVVRPATKTPLSALSLGGILVEAGVPPGAVSVIPCRTELAQKLVEDERVKVVSFTGSAEVGWKLRRVARTPRVVLELGGNGAVIVHSDANLDWAAERCAFGGFLRAGQACISVQRLYVHEDVYDDFRERFLERVEGLTLGNPLDDSTVVGCLVDDAAADKAVALIEEAVGAGAEQLCGGGREGRLVEPTLLQGAPESSRVCATEAFAPIVALQPYGDVDDVIRAAGDTPYGLQAGLFTYDLRIVDRAFHSIETGALIVNDVNSFRVDHMPYGGEKQSGFGREGVKYAIREMTQERMLVVNPE
jgi:glyceraldehyde-3-phosphate dehydrogenase (NADP+)